MVPQPRETRANPVAVSPPLEPEAMPQGTPEGHIQTVVPSMQTQVKHPNPNFVLVPRPQEDVIVPTNLDQQLSLYMQRAELADQAKSFRFTQIEAQLAHLRGRHIADQASPESKDPDRRNPTRQRQRHSPSRESNVWNSPRHHSSWASSSPTRDRSRSQETSKGKGKAEPQDSYRQN